MLELGQIQSTILRQYYRADAPAFERFVFLHFREEQGARALVKQLLPMVTSCADVDAGVRCVLNIGLTYPAVDMFGFGGQTRALDERDHEATGTIEAFKCGMKARAASILGDVDASAPARWQRVYREERIHAVVWLTAHEEASMLETLAKLDAMLVQAPTVERLHDEAAKAFSGEHAGKEHFGYADGIAQPTILGSGIPGFPGDGTPRKRHGWDQLQPGEFVLGQIDESGQTQFRSSFFANGSFMVFRKLRQHVGRFREYVADVAARNGTTPEVIASKMVGRWPSGAPLVLSPHRDDPELGADDQRNNDFRYADDPDGVRCPFGAHIRRNNPREDPSGPGAIQTRLHRVIRRAIPYGSWLPAGAPDDDEERGVLFVAINADIARQFEFVQQNWINSVLSSTVLTLPADRDPIVGQQLRSRSAGKFLIPSGNRKKAPTVAWGLPTFVTTRGGAYFLLPSLDALWDIAHGKRYQDPAECDGETRPDVGGQPAPAEPEPSRPSPCDKLPRPQPTEPTVGPPAESTTEPVPTEPVPTEPTTEPTTDSGPPTGSPAPKSEAPGGGSTKSDGSPGGP